jgi:LPXTG-site transpeptidase (sortase) family protein
MRKRFGTLFLVLGIVLLAVSLGQYGYMYCRQRQLRREWQYNAHYVHVTHPGDSASTTGNADDGLVRLIIPRIQVDDMVVRGTDYSDLLVGPGLVDGTPVPGDPGNSVIAGHRDTFFRHVSDLSPGDELIVRRGAHDYYFRITSKHIVKPSQTSEIDGTPDTELTLVTCYPTYWIGPAPERLVVHSKLEKVATVASR